MLILEYSKQELMKLDDSTIEKKLLHFPEWDYYDNAIHVEDLNIQNFLKKSYDNT